MPPRGRKTNGKTKNGAKNKSNGQKNVLESGNLLKQMGQPLENLLKPNRDLRGPSDEERKFPKWSQEQIKRFLELGEWDSDGDDEETLKLSENNEITTDIEIECPVRAMPLPRPLESVFGAAGGTTSSDVANQTGFLGSLLDPDAGGKGSNKDGLMGFLSAQQPAKPQNPREVLRAKLRYMQKNRGTKPVVVDAKGAKVRGGIQLTPEDMMYGGPRGRNVLVDKDKSAEQRKQMIEKLRLEAAQRKEEKSAQ